MWVSETSSRPLKLNFSSDAISDFVHRNDAIQTRHLKYNSTRTECIHKTIILNRVNDYN